MTTRSIRLAGALAALTASATLVHADAWDNVDTDPKRLWTTNVEHPPGLPGTFGSGLAYDPGDGLYWGVTDRGPETATYWPLRLVRIKVTPVRSEIVQIVPITENGQPVTGDLATGLDPEGVAVSPDGTLWLCDESKPYLLRVTRGGEILERITPPANVLRRTNNQGLEGIAVSADGKTVYTILQSPPADEVLAGNRLRTILLAYDVDQPDPALRFRQYRYQFEDPAALGYPATVSPRLGSSGLAIAGPDELFVIERDNLNPKTGNARLKRIYKVRVPATPTEVPLAKRLVVDVLKLGYGFEKLEGVASPHPRSLVLINDNDGNTALQTNIWQLAF